MSTDENELLVLGDGDFSYSASLVSSRLCKYNLTSTVFLSEQDIISTYGDGEYSDHRNVVIGMHYFPLVFISKRTISKRTILFTSYYM